MKKSLIPLITCALLFAFGSLSAQEPSQLPGAEKEHQLLQRFVGQWESDSEAVMGPDQPAMQCKGSSTARMLGDLWLVSEMTSTMQDTSVTAIQTIGFDRGKNKYVGTWIDSMVNYMWHYEGSFDDAGTTLTLETEGPNYMAAGKMTKFKDAYEFKSPDHIVASSSMMDENGQWVKFMTGNLHRKK